MRVLSLIVREIAWRKLNFALAVLAVTLAVATLVGAVALLRAYDARTQELLIAKEAESKRELDRLEDDYRKITLKLGFNVLVLPKAQNLADLYADDFAAKTMPEDYAERLAKSKVLTVNHLLPVLQQKVKWPERNRTIILVGTRGEVPILPGDLRSALQPAVKPGTVILGYEIWKPLGLKEGDALSLLGRSFTIAKCYAERGTKDDITAWVDLAEAQAMLGKPGLINAIMALSCQCAGDRLATIRREIEKILPDTQVIEFASQAIARAEARERAREHAAATIESLRRNRADFRASGERFAAVLVPVVILAAAAWVALLAFQNVRERQSEIGILRALGMRSSGVLAVFLVKAALTGFVGAAAGYALGLAGARVLASALGGSASATGLFSGTLLALALVIAPVLSAVTAWVPAVAATRRDPALILSEV